MTININPSQQNGKRLQFFWKALTKLWQALTYCDFLHEKTLLDPTTMMSKPENYLLMGALAVFALFFVNVAFGAMRMTVFLSDSSEMLMLFLACVLFVMAIVRCEIREKTKDHR